MTQQTQATVEAPSAEPMDQNELHRLYLLYNRQIHAFFANRGFCQEDSRDLLQQTFLEAWRSRSSFRGENSGGWLFGIAANVWRMSWRNRSRLKRDGQEVSIEGQLPEDSGGQPALQLADVKEASRPLEKCLADEEKRLLRDALEELPERMRFCVVLHLRGYKYREIADLQKVTLNTVRKQIFDGRERLRERLGAYFSDLPGEE